MTFSARFETVELAFFFSLSLFHFYGFDERDGDDGKIKGSVKGTKRGDQDKRGGKKGVCVCVFVYGMVAKRKQMKGWRDGLSFSAPFPSGKLW